MRGALDPFQVEIEGLEKGKTGFSVRYDPRKVTTAQMLTALADKKKPGKLKGE